MGEYPQPNTTHQGERRALYARPEDPNSNTRPPGNGDPEDGALARSIEHLMAVLGR